MILAFSFFQLLFAILPNTALFAHETAISWPQSSAYNAPITISEGDSLVLNQLSLVASIDDKAPGDSLDYKNIAVGQKIWAYADFTNLAAEQNVLFNWIKDDEIYLSFPVQIGISNQWRTYSYITARQGNWRLQLLIEGSTTPIKELKFTVKD
jgi:hypothetical protein